MQYAYYVQFNTSFNTLQPIYVYICVDWRDDGDDDDDDDKNDDAQKVGAHNYFQYYVDIDFDPFKNECKQYLTIMVESGFFPQVNYKGITLFSYILLHSGRFY